ncbi:hypothetical protein ACQJBY_014410 [Aegilops geniculata]
MEFLMQSAHKMRKQQNSARGQREQHPHESSSVPCEDASGRCVADAQICAAEAAPVAGSGDKRQGSENSIEPVDTKTPGWIKGLRTFLWIPCLHEFRDTSSGLVLHEMFRYKTPDKVAKSFCATLRFKF